MMRFQATHVIVDEKSKCLQYESKLPKPGKYGDLPSFGRANSEVQCNFRPWPLGLSGLVLLILVHYQAGTELRRKIKQNLTQ